MTEAEAEAEADKPVLFVLGDSISVHYGAYLEPCLARWFSYRTKRSVGDACQNLDVPTGSNGGDSGMVLAYLRALHATGGLRADLMLLNCGLHDIKVNPSTGGRQVPLDAYATNLEAVVDLIREAAIPLAWMRTTGVVDTLHNTVGVGFHRFASDQEAYNRVADELMRRRGVPIIDLAHFTRTLDEPASLFSDHVHYRDHVRRLQAAFLAGWVLAHAGAMGLSLPQSGGS